jgi:NADH-quinone oxidoreductase subunit J
VIGILSAATTCEPTKCIELPANIAFGIGAVFMIYSAIRMVTTKNIVHAALYLIMVLAGVGMNFLLLQAEFVAVTQFLVYIGAIVVLFLFGIMLTKAPMGISDDLDNLKQRPYAIATALLVLMTLGYALIASFKDTRVKLASPNSVAAVSDSIFGQYLIPFEVTSVLLLAALIGAIVLARKD